MQRSLAIGLFAAVIPGSAVGLAAYTFVYAKGYSYLTNNPAACANCHVMQTRYDAWMKASHHLLSQCIGPSAQKARLRMTNCDYSVMMWSAHSISETKTGGLPNLAP